MESKMLTLKLIHFNIIMFCTKYADILAYPMENIVAPDYYLNYSSGDERISRAGIINMDWLPIGFCNSGMPMLKSRFCNGKKECEDGSDETMERCRNNSCGGDMFRCNYGGCISKISECDGVYQCPDGSDEVYEVCRRNNCILPYPTNDTVYFVPGCEECQNGLPIKEGTILSHQCMNKGFSKENMPNIVCRNGFWTPSLPSCKSNIIKETSSSETSLSGSKPEMPNTPTFPVSSNSTSAVKVVNPAGNKIKDASTTATEKDTSTSATEKDTRTTATEKDESTTATETITTTM